MQLQQLIAELLTLSQAYPDTSPVQIIVPSHSVLSEIRSITADSDETGVIINLNAE